ncbi:MAG: hypothetical protein L0211_17645 [Planctomycetaceae bacterium]|nr:hypothetical protein [Planctomycetaceae bacterium]
MVIQIKSTSERPPPIEMFEVTDPQEIAEARRRREQFDRNSAWLQSHFAEVYTPENRGKVICIAGQEAFVGDDVLEVVARAKAAHPDDGGYFTRRIPRDNRVFVYAN